MADHFMLVWTNPVEGREDEFNKWYNEVHLREVLEVKGFAAATRYKVTENSPAEAGPRPYLAIYEIEGDPNDAFQNMMASVSKFNMSEALDMENSLIQFYSPCSERQVSK